MADQKKLIQSWEDRAYFPPFSTIPSEYEISIGLYPEKHYCLLAEIVLTDTILRPRLLCRDITGFKFTVEFYCRNETDMPRILEHFTPGNTIVLFYAPTHVFEDKSINIRLNSSRESMIIPLELSDAITMNKQAVEFVNRDGTSRKCHGCGEVKANLDKCGRCMLFHYCNQECQRKGWDEHKKFCKILKNENVKKMLALDYADISDGPIHFVSTSSGGGHQPHGMENGHFCSAEIGEA
ncbi:hypothetical protein F5Y12DRAFT_800153 [Xylaria sp. FL1777]|nr:hypothetical protein F5Y12DRAFT_800153 [Xylaria sp. FL1777]